MKCLLEMCETGLDFMSALTKVPHTGADPGWGMGGPMPPPPSGLSKHKTWRFTARLMHVATPMQHISLYKAPCKHKALKFAAPKRQFGGSAPNIKADSKGKEFPIDKSP